MQHDETPLILGRINGVFGIKGWLKILSFTRPRENIFDYEPLYVHAASGWQQIDVEATQKRGGKLLMKLVNIETPEEARKFNGCELGIRHDQLPALPQGQYYWHQLIGLRVINQDEQPLGIVVDIKETGANDVLVIKSSSDGRHRYLVPLIMDIYIKNVDLASGQMQVDWQLDE